MRLRVLLTSFILSILFWLGINIFVDNLENFLFFQEIAKNPEIFTAQVSHQTFFNPVKIFQEELKINANSAISVWVDNFQHQKILFRKDSDEKLPIASLTKLMTAYVVLENYELSQVIKFSKNALGHDEDFGKFKMGEEFTVKDLLYSLLMESSNDAVYALLDVIGEDAFVDLMNMEAKNILGSSNQNTVFFNPTGLDNAKINYSTAEDLAKLTIIFLKKQPLIWEILGQPDFDLYTSDSLFHHKILNTNKLLGKIPGIVGGKTGETQKAGGCLLLVLKSPNNQGFLINIILGSEDRFGQMEKLINWLKVAYQW